MIASLKRFSLQKEALLLDSKLYIIKSALAVATGYIAGSNLPIVNMDMISVLLGVMYNLEPINVAGIRGGLSQLAASAVGAFSTAVLISLFGINVYTIAFAMALTIFVSLKMSWRMVSPVAIFTCIYMTQYVQLDSLGNPSVLLTFRLRILALSLGVSIAVFYNYIFSFFYYRKIAFKRLEFIKLQTLSGLSYIRSQLDGKSADSRNPSIYQGIFNDIELVSSNINTMLDEAEKIHRSLNKEKLLVIVEIIDLLKKINHLVYDLNFTRLEFDNKGDISANAYADVSDALLEFSKFLQGIDFSSDTGSHKEIPDLDIQSRFEHLRIKENISMIQTYLNQIKLKAHSL